ncbi:YhcB family protein [Wenzhouxiangella sediminis]|nr:DUF1043 family protein [Wenzhouxiangella sediminis]
MTWGIIGLLVGLAVGAALVWLLVARRTHAPSVNQLKAENERFREEVNAHFVQTAQLINELTDSYKKVFDHLSDGAERLVDKEAVRERMPQVGHREVRLRHIGAPRDYRPTGSRSRPEKPKQSSPDRASAGDEADDDSSS